MRCALNVSFLRGQYLLQIRSGPDGDYFRLLTPGKYNVSVTHQGYDTHTREVEASADLLDSASGAYSAKVVNFTLTRDNSEEWSKQWDYDIKKNLKDSYLSNSEIEEEIANMENEYPNLAEVFMNEADWSNVISVLLLKDDNLGSDPKVNICLFGGLYGSQPIGRELLIRLARHLAQGHKVKDSRVMNILEKINIYFIPMIDLDGFNRYNAGECKSKSLSKEAGSKFGMSFQRSPAPIRALKKFLSIHKIDVGLSLESEGIFMRLPWDEEQGGSSSQSDISVEFLAQTYFANHKDMSDINREPCTTIDGRQPNGLVHGTLLSRYLFYC
jgi:hypothetical protein